MSCEKTDCKNYDSMRCVGCFDFSEYLPPKQIKTMVKKNYNKPSKRMGTTFEMTNHNQNKAMLDSVASSNMTPNSGAGHVKGDEQIRGIINVMEELKTLDPERARGHSSFSIKREWLDKLDREGPKENMEFWYLKFAYKDTDTKSYTVIDSEQMMSMIATIIHDRKIAKEADCRIDVANKRASLKEAESVKLFAEVEYLKSLLKQHNINY